MAELSPPRFEQGRAFLLAGIRRHHRFVDALSTVSRQWREFREHPHFRGPRAPRAYGAMCSTSGDSFEYMTALEVDSFDGLPADMGRMRVPAQQYAVFTHSGNVATLPETWQIIMEQWLPQSDYRDAETPAFELYDQRFDPATGEGGVEIWLPVMQ